MTTAGHKGKEEKHAPAPVSPPKIQLLPRERLAAARLREAPSTTNQLQCFQIIRAPRMTEFSTFRAWPSTKASTLDLHSSMLVRLRRERLQTNLQEEWQDYESKNTSPNFLEDHFSSLPWYKLGHCSHKVAGSQYDRYTPISERNKMLCIQKIDMRFQIISHRKWFKVCPRQLPPFACICKSKWKYQTIMHVHASKCNQKRLFAFRMLSETGMPASEWK